MHNYDKSLFIRPLECLWIVIYQIAPKIIEAGIPNPNEVISIA